MMEREADITRTEEREPIKPLAEAVEIFIRCVDNGYFGKKGLRTSPIMRQLRESFAEHQKAGS
jgi:hypothetical protein